MNIKCIILASLFPLIAAAHGEDSAGPNGGHVRMPGAFHTELRLENPQELRVYLIDMEFKNPSVKDSKVEITWHNRAKKIAFKCVSTAEIYFTCKAAKDIPAQGELRIQATREKAVGQEIIYKLPLASFK